jgi:hypothetical protein
MGTRSFFSGTKRLEPSADHSSLSIAEMKHARNFTTTPFIRLHDAVFRHKDNVTFMPFKTRTQTGKAHRSRRLPVVVPSIVRRGRDFSRVGSSAVKHTTRFQFVRKFITLCRRMISSLAVSIQSTASDFLEKCTYHFNNINLRLYLT